MNNPPKLEPVAACFWLFFYTLPFFGLHTRNLRQVKPFDSDEIRAVDEIRDVLARVKGGVYEPINTNRPNYKEKLTRWGVKHFVRYDIEINGIPFELKMEAKQDKSHNKMYEHPYSLKKKRDK